LNHGRTSSSLQVKCTAITTISSPQLRKCTPTNDAAARFRQRVR
jgi:hypothetical protein